jgi:hypothetical protein
VPRVQLCEECGGSGAHLYERGPAAERCPRCGGVGLRFGDPASAARDLRDLLTASGADASELLALGPGGALRALAAALALVEERVAATERELARKR